jgi:hypothetical protein
MRSRHGWLATAGAFAVSAAILMGATTALAATPSSTTGGVSFSTKKAVDVSLQINAYQYAEGSLKGQQQYTSASLSWHGDTPICYVLLSPTTAVFAGPISSSTNPSLVGEFYVIEAVDSTSASVPDQVGVEILSRQPTSCQHLKVTLNSVTSGNLVVH